MTSSLQRQQRVRFESVTAQVLARFKCDVKTTSRSHDRGVDLIGSWHLDSNVELDVVVQCKYQRRPVGVSKLRELQGSVLAYQSLTRRRRGSFVAMFASASGFSPFTVKHAIAAEMPMMLWTLADPFAPGMASFASPIHPDGAPIQERSVDDDMNQSTVTINPALERMLPGLAVSRQRILVNNVYVLKTAVMYNGRVVDVV